MSAPPLKKRVSLRTAKRDLAVAAEAAAALSPTDRVRLTATAEIIAREEVQQFRRQQQAALQGAGATTPASSSPTSLSRRASDAQPADVLALLQQAKSYSPSAPVSGTGGDATPGSLSSQVEAVTALSSLFQPTNLTPQLSGSTVITPTLSMHSPPLHQVSPNLLSPAQVHTPNALAVSRASSFAMPVLNSQQSYGSFGYPSTPRTPSFGLTFAGSPAGIMQNMMAAGGAAAAAAMGMQLPTGPTGMFLSPPMPHSPQNSFRTLHLGQQNSYISAAGGNALQLAQQSSYSTLGSGSHSPSHAPPSNPYKTTKLPILHSWYWNPLRNRATGEAVPHLPPHPGPEVEYSSKEAFARSLKAALRANLRCVQQCIPVEDLNSLPVWVNSKQYKRFLHRAAARKRKAAYAAAVGARRGAAGAPKHLSRQLHAARRVRGAGGRFLTKEEREQLDREAAAGGGGSNMVSEDED